MAQSVTTDDGVELVIPNAYAQYTVQAAQGGLATVGAVALVGESDSGPDFTEEDELASNVFGPTQIADVKAKYGTGPLVDAFSQLVSASNDPQVQGSPSAIIIAKTNPSVRATAALGAYGKALYAKLAGDLGNLISRKVESAQAEVLPTTGAFAFIPAVGTVHVDVVANGGSVQPITLSAAALPSAFKTAIDGLTDVAASGGVARGLLGGVTGNLTVTKPGTNKIVVSYSTTWTVAPQVGDTLLIPTGSAIVGAGSANIGAYIVTAATTNSVSATKLSDYNRGGAVIGTITDTIAVSSQAVAATTDINAYSPVTITVNGTLASVIDGVSKTLEIAENTGGSDLLSRCAFTLVSGAPVASTWVSKTDAATALKNGAEYRAKLTVTRAVDNVNDSATAGGTVLFKAGYAGTSATIEVTDTDVTVTAAGGSNAGTFTKLLTAFPTINDFAQYLTNAGWVAAAGTPQLGQKPLSQLDRGTFNCNSAFGAYTGLIKRDAFDFAQAVSANIGIAQLGSPAARADAGLPAVLAIANFASGARGGTTNSIVTDALSALELARVNFVVPLFSQDASSDIEAGVTDSTSTYTILDINASFKAHVVEMSKLKRRKSRQTVVSIQDTYDNAKTASGMLGSYRAAQAFQSVKTLDAYGTIKSFQPWQNAVTAVGMQVAGFYKAIFNKSINVTAAVQAAGDWNDLDDANLEDALQAGLLPIVRSDTGGYKYASDQTTYTKDNNFVYNSLQAVYVSDVIAMTTRSKFEQRYVGQSPADVSATSALSFLKSLMDQYKRMKLIAPSDGAPLGYKNASIRISGPSMIVSFEVKLAGAIYFIPINFLVTQVEQTAS